MRFLPLALVFLAGCATPKPCMEVPADLPEPFALGIQTSFEGSPDWLEERINQLSPKYIRNDWFPGDSIEENVFLASVANEAGATVVFTVKSALGDRGSLGYGFRTSDPSRLRNAVSALSDFAVIWELGNELDKQAEPREVFHWSLGVSQNIWEADPDAVIAGPGASGYFEESFLWDLFELGYLDLIDILTVHTYPDRPGNDIENARDLRRTLAHFTDRCIPVLVSECGFPERNPSTPWETRAEMLENLALGMESSGAIGAVFYRLAPGDGILYFYDETGEETPLVSKFNSLEN